MKHNQVIQREFSKQASKFGDKGLTLSNQDIFDWIVNLLPLEKGFRVLDVAAGTGLLSRAVAHHVNEVIAIDITPQMLASARAETTRYKLTNISFEQGSAEQLPHAADCFDLVTARLAIHHFENPILQLREMIRVCKPGRTIAIIDLLAPEDRGLAETYNGLERTRDPSHTIALSKTQMGKMLAGAGIAVQNMETRDVQVDFQKWVQMTGTKPESVNRIEQALMKDIHDGSETGMRPFLENDSLKFLQVWSVMIGKTFKPT